MPTQTFDQLMDTWTALVNLWEETENFGRTNTANYLALEDVIRDAQEDSDFGDQVMRGVLRGRANLNQIITAAARVSADAWLLDVARFLNVQVSDPATILEELRDHFNDNTLTVQERNFNFTGAAVPAAGGSNVGSGTFTRLNIDRFGEEIEAQYIEAKSIICRRDQNSGTRPGLEEFEFNGTRFIDPLSIDESDAGSGLRIPRQVCLHPSKGLLQNPSFDTFSGTVGAPDTIQGWTWSGTMSADLNIDQSTVYLPALNSSITRGSVEVTTNGTLSQALSIRNAQLSRFIPYRLRMWVNKGTATGGTITIHQGSKSQAFTVVSLSAGWNELAMDLDTDLWLDNFNEDALDIKIVVTSLSGGNFFFDDLYFGPLIQFGGGWYDLAPRVTPFMLNDTFTWTDALTGADGKLQRWFHRLYGTHMPDTTAANPPSEPDP